MRWGSSHLTVKIGVDDNAGIDRLYVGGRGRFGDRAGRSHAIKVEAAKGFAPSS